MKLTQLSLTNFRSYKKFSLGLDKTVILVGPNGVGKTNLIEAIYMLSIMKSYRALTDSEVIRFGEEFAKITGRIENSELKIASQKSKKGDSANLDSQATNSDEIELVIHQNRKKAKKNGAEKPLSQLIGTLKAVLFSPEQLEVITGPPRRRRRFLDSLLSQINPRYTNNLLEYQKALHNRNALLLAIKQGGASAAELYFWDKRLIETGTVIGRERAELVRRFNKLLSTHYQAVADSHEEVMIVPRFQVPTHELFQEHLSADIQLAATTVGPHRDNFTLQIGRRDLGLFGSRGEWRSALFALKATEVTFLQEQAQAAPVLLLDDVFSELDKRRRERLFAHPAVGQTILTTTDLSYVTTSLKDQAQVVEVADYAKTSN